MSAIELKTTAGKRFIYDLASGWEIYDEGDMPALWTNYREGRNLSAVQTYEEIRPLFNLTTKESSAVVDDLRNRMNALLSERVWFVKTLKLLGA